MKQIAISEAKTGPSYTQLEARKLSCARLLEGHPSVEMGARFKFNRLTLQVPTDYNVGFNYCDKPQPHSSKNTEEKSRP